jgi:hypothetical protein
VVGEILYDNFFLDEYTFVECCVTSAQLNEISFPQQLQSPLKAPLVNFFDRVQGVVSTLLLATMLRISLIDQYLLTFISPWQTSFFFSNPTTGLSNPLNQHFHVHVNRLP